MDSSHRFLDSPLPLVAAPMAGVTTPALAEAAARAGAFAFLPAGYLTAEALGESVARARGWGRDFGVNLFVPAPGEPDEAETRAEVEAYAQALAPEFERLGVAVPEPRLTDDDAWAAKLDLLWAEPVPVVSFTFGLPQAPVLARFREVGTRTLATVTTHDEARRAVAAGVDGLVVQGVRAGGHSGTWDPVRDFDDAPTAQLVCAVRAETDVPLVAAGGVDGPSAVRELLDSGAESVVVGTLLLRTDEAGTSPTHRLALADPRFTDTVLTRAFTGRPARSLANRFAETYTPQAVGAYPAVHHLTRALRTAAAQAGDAETLHLWAGTGYRAARDGSVADTLAWLAP